MASRDRLIMPTGAVLVAVGLSALWFPVFLGGYDRYGVQVKCGNGYHSQLLQATASDQQPVRQSAPDSSPAIRAATHYADQCTSALARRRVWGVSTVAFGAMTLVFGARAGARRQAMDPPPVAPTQGWTEAPDDYLHEAANLDRRGLPRRDRPAETTL